jgi:hypothetical protein
MHFVGTPYPRERGRDRSLASRRLGLALCITAVLPLPVMAYASFYSPPGISQAIVGFLSLGWFCGHFVVSWMFGEQLRVLRACVMAGLASVVVGLTPVIFAARFRVAQPVLQSLVLKSVKGESVPIRYGAAGFEFTTVEERKGMVTVWTPGERAFVRSAHDPSQDFKTAECFKLDGNWWYVIED